MNLACVKIFSAIFLVVSFSTSAQRVVKEINDSDIDSTKLAFLKREYSNKKKMPAGLEKPILIALSYYPELKDVKIVFKVRKSRSPLKSKPDFFDTFLRQAKKRKYIIVVSSKPMRYLEHVKYSVLNFNAQVGVMGHELSHVSDFSGKNLKGILGMAFSNLSHHSLDKLEFNTDRETIEHGLGFQLLAWSNAVRDTANFKKYTGVHEIHFEQLREIEEMESERYMRPTTIINILKIHPLYMEIYGKSEE